MYSRLLSFHSSLPLVFLAIHSSRQILHARSFQPKKLLVTLSSFHQHVGVSNNGAPTCLAHHTRALCQMRKYHLGLFSENTSHVKENDIPE